MLKTKWIEKRIKYDGTQLRPLYAYLEHQVLGPSVIAFRGPCQVDFSKMVDGEDLLDQSAIRGGDMIHFLFELFDESLITGVFLQRLFASIVGDVILTLAREPLGLHRSGDDLFVGKRKLSISVATRSTASILVHFAVNVTNEATPVKTVSLSDFGINPKEFAKNCLDAIQTEYESILLATYKVRPVV